MAVIKKESGKTKIKLGFWFLVIVLIYLALAFRINKNIFGQSNTPYFNYLTEAFSNKRLNVLPRDSAYDLTFFNEKLYLYWGPAPVVFILPFYLLFGSGASDVFYTLIAGILNTLIFALVCKELISHFKLKMSKLSFLLVWLSFALASPNLFLSLAGRVWYTSQIIGIFYLLLFLFFYFKFLKKTKSVIFWTLAVVFYNLAWLSRYTLVFYGLIFIYPFWLCLAQRRKGLAVKKMVIILLATSLLFGTLMIFYNQARFGSFFELGFRYQKGSQRYYSFLKKWGSASLVYLPHNITHYLLIPIKFSLEEPPYLHIDLEGNSVFSVYPFLWLFLLLFQKKYWRKSKRRVFFGLAIVSLFFVLFRLLLNLGTGYVHFGNRYFLDVIPLLFLTLLIVIEKVPVFIQLCILFYGVIVNILGVLVFYQTLQLLGHMPG